MWWEWAGAADDANDCWGTELDALTEAEQGLHSAIVLVPDPLHPGAASALPGFAPDEWRDAVEGYIARLVEDDDGRGRWRERLAAIID
jgi:hypothetical protein